uniref:MULE transposase domain-containing protein n=1 Tax=Lactuca sativa TaxID=4236 RepID=A0A9R1X7P9_LACSA|nr:hypothetical protein LSAT_V11C600317580 [Lactuca sativa]
MILESNLIKFKLKYSIGYISAFKHLRWGLKLDKGLYGCFLKGSLLGKILIVVGIDSNNGIYLIAYTWFLEYLGDDLDLDASCNFTFVSDRQKGLIPSIEKVYPNEEHRWCLRYIDENMKLQWRGEEVKDHLWTCATRTNLSHFERAMKELAHSYCLLNNMCEVFISKLEHGMGKPIITYLEYIRVYLMKRNRIVQKEIDKCRSTLIPTATTILEKKLKIQQI